MVGWQRLPKSTKNETNKPRSAGLFFAPRQVVRRGGHDSPQFAHRSAVFRDQHFRPANREQTMEAPPFAGRYIPRSGFFGSMRAASSMFWGVVLPMVAIGVELFTHMCAEALFDPIPTLWHL